MPWNEPGSDDKDPWGGGNRNRGGQSPDLEEVINNVRKRFGGGGSGRSGGLGGFSPLILLLIAGVVFVLMRSFYQVDEGHQSIELRFGKYKQTVGAGLQFILWPIERKIVINTQQIRTVEVGYRGGSSEVKEAQMLTQDENLVDVTMAVQYTIKSVEDLVFNVGDLSYDDGLSRVVRSATESALREVVGRTDMDPLLTTDRPVVDSETRSLLQAILDRYEAGIDIFSIEIQDVRPPQQVRDAFDDVVKAKQDQETKVNQAEAYSKRIVPEARGRAEAILQEAEAYKSRVVAEATGEAERFNQILTEYRKAPEITKKRLYIESMESVLSNSSKVMIDQSGNGGNSLMYLPIDQILQGAQQRRAAASTSIDSSVTSSSDTVSTDNSVLRTGR